jgi:hypothetical protein
VNEPAATGPRLVYDADTTPNSSPGSNRPSAAPTRAPRDRSRTWLVVALVAFALLAGFEWRRAVALEARVAELTNSLATAEAEIAARREQLGAIRTAVDDLSQRVAGLAALASDDPGAARVPPADAAPAQ